MQPLKFENHPTHTVEVWEWISNFIPHFTKLIHVSKGAHGNGNVFHINYPFLWNFLHKKLVTRKIFTCHGVILSSFHYDDVTMGAIAPQVTSLVIVYSTVYSDADQRKHQSSASLAVVQGIHRRPVNSTHKWPVTRKMFPFDDVIMLGHNSVGVEIFYRWPMLNLGPLSAVRRDYNYLCLLRV